MAKCHNAWLVKHDKIELKIYNSFQYHFYVFAVYWIGNLGYVKATICKLYCESNRERESEAVLLEDETLC